MPDMWPTIGVKMSQLRCFCDIETTGLDPKVHEIISIAVLVTVDDRELTRWELKIKPKNIENASPEALCINGYNETDWKDAVNLDVALLPIADLFSKKILFIGYNPGFDLSFIRTALEAHGHHLRRLRMIDVMTLVHEHLYTGGWGKMTRLNLDSVREYLGMDSDNAHQALQDVLDTKYVYDRLTRSNIFTRLWWRVKFKLRQIKN